METTRRHLGLDRLPVLALLLLASCAASRPAVIVSGERRISSSRWVLLPLLNYSETPRADDGARAILRTVLRARGAKVLAEAPGPARADEPLPDLDGRSRLENALSWSRKANFPLGFTGSVNEWRYRGSPDRPAVSLSLSVVDVKSGDVLWTASGATSGEAGETVSGTALLLMQQLLAGLEIE
jgi:polysaccharide biosynthesis protein PelC